MVNNIDHNLCAVPYKYPYYILMLGFDSKLESIIGESD